MAKHMMDIKTKALLIAGFLFVSSFIFASVNYKKRSFADIDSTKRSRFAIHGPLRVSDRNSRYFTDSTGKAIYLTGSHTWCNFQDNRNNIHPNFDFARYLDFLKGLNHNFIRLWAWEGIRESAWENNNAMMQPMMYQIASPAIDSDHRPVYDLSLFNQAYFDRLRQRISEASERGIYVGVMLFQGFSVAKKSARAKGNPWPGHPYHTGNNINGINGDSNGDGNGYEVHTLDNPAITVLQEAYVRKVVETVGDFENIIYEISNESHGGSTAWQYHMIDLIREIEQSRKFRHPVWMSFQFDGTIGMGLNKDLFYGKAEVISPSHQDNAAVNDYENNPPVADGSKVIIIDTDHLWGIGGDEIWVWKSFTRGLNPVFMDRYLENTQNGNEELNPKWTGIRKAMGHTLSYATKMNLIDMIPTDDSLKCSTGYCLENKGKAYLVFQPESSPFFLELRAGKYRVEWFNPIDGKQSVVEIIRFKTHKQEFMAPWDGPAVLYLVRKGFD